MRWDCIELGNGQLIIKAWNGTLPPPKCHNIVLDRKERDIGKDVILYTTEERMITFTLREKNSWENVILLFYWPACKSHAWIMITVSVHKG